jgi:7-keto-8-aminopelargonate synthetase-like enzyme
LKEQRITSRDELPVAERVLFDVLPIQNAGPWIQMNGHRFLQFSTNDYLGISVHPKIRETAAEYARLYGISAPMGARPLTGTIELHLELEKKVAEFKGTEAALTFTTGANAMMGVIGGLARPGDLVIMDQLAHASLICGAKIAGASIKYFRHNDPKHLEQVLSQAAAEQPKLIVVDGVYSMSGEIAPLKEICDIRDRFNARLLVDDAHGNGVCGPTGRGAAELLGVQDRIDIHAGTFSKAFGTSGGFVAADRSVIFYIRTLSPSLLFTKAPSACATATTIKALELVKNGRDLREALWNNTRYLQGLLSKKGMEYGSTETPITPVALGGNTALFAADILRRNHNIFVSAVLYPAIRRGSAILRIIPTALHQKEDFDHLVDSIEAAVREHERSGIDSSGGNKAAGGVRRAWLDNVSG